MSRRRCSLCGRLPRAGPARPRHPDGDLARARRTPSRRRPAGGGRGRRAARRVPTRLEVPPEVAQAYSGDPARAGRTRQTARRASIDVPLGGGAPLPGSVARRARRRLPAGVHDGRRRDHVRRRRAAEPGRADHRLREGQGDLRRLDLHAVSRTCIPFTHPRFQLRLDGGVPQGAEVTQTQGGPSASSSRAAPTSASRRSSTSSSGGGGRSCTTCPG